MIKFFAALLFCVCTSVSAWAGNMETVTLRPNTSRTEKWRGMCWRFS